VGTSVQLVEGNSITTTHISSDRVNSSSNRNLQQHKIILFWGDHCSLPTSCSGLFCNFVCVLYLKDIVWFVAGFAFKWEGETKNYRAKLLCVI